MLLEFDKIELLVIGWDSSWGSNIIYFYFYLFIYLFILLLLLFTWGFWQRGLKGRGRDGGDKQQLGS